MHSVRVCVCARDGLLARQKNRQQHWNDGPLLGSVASFLFGLLWRTPLYSHGNCETLVPI